MFLSPVSSLETFRNISCKYGRFEDLKLENIKKKISKNEYITFTILHFIYYNLHYLSLLILLPLFTIHLNNLQLIILQQV